MEIVVLIIIGCTVYAVAAVYTYFDNSILKYNSRGIELEALNKELERRIDLIRDQEENLKSLSKQYSEGFPLLAEAYAEYLSLYDGRYAHYLENKSHPAQKSADIVRDLSKQKTEAVKNAKIIEYINKYYETLAPFLIDAKGELLDDLEARKVLEEYTSEERLDPTIMFLSKEEYRKLPAVKRNQLALDRYWDRKKIKRSYRISL